MKKTIFLILAVTAAIGCRTTVLAWGREGHRAVAYIAERNLTPQARKVVEATLDGGSMTDYSLWLDEHRHTCDFDFETHRPVGRPVKQLKDLIENLKDYEHLTDSARRVNLYMIIHLMGDYHCPGHANYVKDGLPDKISSSKYQVWLVDGKRAVKYHKLWDKDVLTDNHGDWTEVEYAIALDSSLPQSEREAIVAGTVEDWLTESAHRSWPIYSWFDCEQSNMEAADGALPRVDRKMLNEFGYLACDQIERAGLRLAKILNDLFGK